MDRKEFLKIGESCLTCCAAATGLAGALGAQSRSRPPIWRGPGEAGSWPGRSPDWDGRKNPLSWIRNICSTSTSKLDESAPNQASQPCGALLSSSPRGGDIGQIRSEAAGGFFKIPLSSRAWSGNGARRHQ